MQNILLKLYKFFKVNFSFNITKIIKHNKKYFTNFNKIKNGIILIEFNHILSAHITYPYLIKVLNDKNNSEVISYSPNKISKLHFFLNIFLLPFNLGVYSIYKSFGSSKLISPNLTNKYFGQITNIRNKIKNKNDLIDLKIDGIWVGDLIYDSYLMKYNLPTIDFQKKSFDDYFKYSIKIYYFWRDYFNKNKINAICVSHCCYLNALPLRIAISKNIKSYMIHLQKCYKLDKNNLFADKDFLYYKEVFSQFTNNDKIKFKKLAFDRIKLRFDGKIGVDMPYSNKSAYSDKYNKKRIIKKSSKIKILIAAHCFSDSPHGHGKQLFADFYDWIDFLGKLSDNTDYDWYIKSHPDFKISTKKILIEFVKKYKKFNLIPSDSSHHQIIKEGINFALTCVGTIGFEYPMLGIPVINASQNNPHISYNFNLHPKNITEYEKLLRNLNQINFKIDKSEIAEFYYMNNIYNTNKLFFKDYEKMENKLGGYKKQFNPIVFDYWINEFRINHHYRILKTLNQFVSSNDYRLRKLF